MEDQAVTWTVENDPGSANVDASGVFTANLAGTYRVFATSTPNQALKGSAVLTVVSSVTPLPNAPVVGALRGYSVTALADGRILIAGGTDGPTFFATARLFDPETKVFSNTPAMRAPRAYHTATLLADGRVLLAGGVGERDEFGGLVANAWAEVFNPVTNLFEALPEGPLPNGGTRAGVMRSPHATGVLLDFLENDGHGQSVATVLGNNQVLIAGGPMVHGYGFGGGFDQFPQRRMTDLFTPGTTPGMDTFDVSNWVGNEAPDDVQGWALTSNAILTPKGAQILTLNDGRALMTGGLVSPYQNLPVIPEPYRSGLIMPDSKTYSPGSGFADAAPMLVPRAYHTMTKLSDGRVLIVGGYASLTLSDDFNTSLIWHRTTTGTAEVYDPATGGFTFVGSLIFPRARHAAILLPTGKVMIVGGRTTNGDGSYSHPKIIELFDPETGAFEVMEELEYGIEEPKLALEPDGGVFVMGTIQGMTAASTATSFSGQNQGAMGLAGASTPQNGTVQQAEILPQPWIEIDGGQTQFWISAHGATSDDPVMPEIPAKIKGIPDIQKRTVTWEAQALYTTHQKSPINLSDPLPFVSKGEKFPTANQIFVKDGAPVMRGGKIRITVKIKASGGKEVTGWCPEIQVLARNPEAAKVDSWLAMDGMTLTIPAVDASSSSTTIQVPGCTFTDWMRAIARQESGGTLRQFVGADETLRAYWAVGEPRMNSSPGDGGMGMMQITNNDRDSLRDDKRFSVLWDWVKNVSTGKEIFQGSLRAAGNFADRVRNYPSFSVYLNGTNSYRRLYYNPPLPPLDAILVRDLTLEELLVDGVRGYNGYGPVLGSFFGLRWHEWRLQNSIVPASATPYLSTTNERVLPDGRRVADAIWEPVPVSERGPGGDPDYVNHVLRFKQNTCP